jgi:2-hydroxymuconate-semialdehyde hydrolase
MTSVKASVRDDQVAIRTRDVAVGEYVLRVHETGDVGKDTVLFLHGSGPGATGLSNWEAVITDLADRYHCIAPDILGFGDSTHPDDPPRGMGPFGALRVETLLGLLDALGVDRTSLVGNSMGGLFSLRMVIAAPTRINKMVLMGSGGSPVGRGPELGRLVDFYDDPTVENMARLMSAFVYEPRMFGDRLHEIAASRMPRAIRPEVQRSHLATFDAAAPADVVSNEDLQAIEQQTLLIHGREDQFVPLAASYHFFEQIPNSQLHALGKCGHWTQIEHRARFVNLIDAFLHDAVK